MKKILSFLLCLILIYNISYAQSDIGIQWQKSFGGAGNEFGFSIQQTTDGGYIMAGYTDSHGGDVNGNHGGQDYLVIKIGPSGEYQWQKCYGGTGDEVANSIQQTLDGGYIIAGNSGSNDGDVTGIHGNQGYQDCWVVKIDALGVIQWQKCYGGSLGDAAMSIKQTIDGSYIMAGYTGSYDGDVIGNHGTAEYLNNNWADYWVVKIDPSGAIQWQKCYGGLGLDMASNIEQTSDGGFIIAGSSASNDGDVLGNHGTTDSWVVKTDHLGAIQWQKCYGGSGEEHEPHIQQTKDGGYIMSSMTNSNNGDVTGNHGGTDSWVIKTDQSGVIKWQKCYGGTGTDGATDIKPTFDGGFIMTGLTNSIDGDVTSNYGEFDTWVVKTDLLGAIQWQKCFGGTSGDFELDIIQSSDGSYTLFGASSSIDGDLTTNQGGQDYWIVKLCVPDPLSISISDLTYCLSTTLTTSDGFVSYLWSNGQKTRTIDVTKGGTYSVVGINAIGCATSSEIVVPDPIPPYLGDKIEISDPNFCVSTTLIAADGFTSYLWSTGETTRIIDVTSGGTYSVFATFSSGCTSRSEILVPDPIPPYLGDKIEISNPNYCKSTTLTAAAGFESYLWSTGQTSQMINVYSAGLYSVVATYISGCTSKSEIAVSDPNQPYEGEQICMVTLDEQTGKNNIIIEKTLNVGIDSILTYRMDNLTSQYKRIGSISADNISIFIDDEAIPAQQSYQYRISIKDSCGNESSLSNIHSTMLLQANIGINGEVNLFWNPYEGFNYPNFQIYRSNGGNPFNLIANVSTNLFTFTDLTPPAGAKKYQVRISKGTSCTPTKSSYGYVASNVLNTGTYGIDENLAVSFSIQPNPVSDWVKLTSGAELLGSDYIIADLAGRMLLTGKIIAEDTEINLSRLSEGMYTIRIARQNTKAIKIIKK